MYNNKYIFTVNVKNVPAREYVHQGNTYIEGRKGSEYTLKFANHTSDRVMVVFSVDGLSVLDGKPAGTKSLGYIFNPYNSGEIPGWTINSNKVAKFTFSPAGDRDQTYVEALAAEGFNVDVSNMGAIGAMVFKEKPRATIGQFPWTWERYNTANACWTKYPGTFTSANASDFAKKGLNISYGMKSISGSNPTRGASMGASWSAEPQASVGTGFGAETAFHTTQTTFEPMASPDTIFVIEYDTLIGLKRRGVPVQEAWAKNKAFPGLEEGCHVPKNWRG